MSYDGKVGRTETELEFETPHLRSMLLLYLAGLQNPDVPFQSLELRGLTIELVKKGSPQAAHCVLPETESLTMYYAYQDGGTLVQEDNPVAARGISSEHTVRGGPDKASFWMALAQFALRDEVKQMFLMFINGRTLRIWHELDGGYGICWVVL